MHFSKIFMLAFAVGAFGEEAPTLPQVADAVVPAAPDAPHVPFAAGVRGDAAPPALPKLADVADAVAPAVSDAPLFRGRGAAPSVAAMVAAETTRAGLRASAPETRGTLKLESKWKANHSSGVAVQEEENTDFGRGWGPPPMPVIPGLPVDYSVFYHGARILLKQPDHNTYLGMCGHDTTCGGPGYSADNSNYGVAGFPSSSNDHVIWRVEREGNDIYLKKSNHNAYLGFGCVQGGCGGSSHGVYGYHSRSEHRTKFEVMQELSGGYYYLKQVDHSYLGMCGVRECAGSSHRVLGFSSRQSRTRWEVRLY